MRYLIGVFAALLGGCATFGQMEEGLSALMGKSEAEAFAVIGYPSSKDIFAGDTVYTWLVSQSGTILVPQVATTTGFVGRVPVYGSTTYSQPMAINHSCTIKLVANSAGILKNWEYNGNLGGCRRYIMRLKDYAKNRSDIGLRSSYNRSEDLSEPNMACEVDADCDNGKSCRSRKGGGTECRLLSF